MNEKEEKEKQAFELAHHLRHGYFTRTGYLGLSTTATRFPESDLQRKLSIRLEKLACDSAMADYLIVADYIENHPLDYEDYYTRAYHRREEGAKHAVSFRQFAIHSPAQRRKSTTGLCVAAAISVVRGLPSLIEWLGVSNEQIHALQELWAEYTRREEHAETQAELGVWLDKARSEVFTPEQHAIWKRMADENGPPPEPPVLASSEIASVAEVEQLSPVFKAARAHAPLDLSPEQKESLEEFTEIVRTGIIWIKQFEYSKLYFPKDPSFADEDPMGKTIKEAMFHADQYVLLKILTAQQFDQLVPSVIGEREEFPWLKYPTAS